MKKQQLIVLYAVSMLSIAACFFIKPIHQDQAYHNFADRVTLLSLPNFWNVVSNLPFVIIGILGLAEVIPQNKFALKPSYIWFFIGITATGFGSGYYHLEPNDTTLIWDRLPMTVSFMSFLSIIIGEFIQPISGKKLLYPFLIIGLASIVYWVVSEDLRMYVCVQFLPIVLILIILFLSKNNSTYKKYFWLIIVSYTLAKFLESYDLFIYDKTYQALSGHTLKHLAAAAGPFLFYKFAKKKFQIQH